MKIVKVKLGGRVFRIKDCAGIHSARGLMFDKMENHDGALIYANSIWMPFVKQELMLIFLDDKMRVLSSDIAKPISFNNSKTWKIYKNEKAKYCLELKDTKINIRNGVKINFEGP